MKERSNVRKNKSPMSKNRAANRADNPNPQPTVSAFFGGPNETTTASS